MHSFERERESEKTRLHELTCFCSRPGYKKRIPGHGMPLMTDPDKYGDIIIDFVVEYPIGLSPDQKLFIKEALINYPNHKKQQQQQHANHFKKKHLFHGD